MLNRYVAERFLYRLSLTEHRNHFLLKGAVLLAVWSDQPYRQTKDIDMLGMGNGSIPRIEKVFREVCAVPSPDDGLLLDATTLAVETIRDQQEYGGVRVTLDVFLGKARIPLQIDVGFGDAVTPQVTEIEFGGLLGLPPVRLRAYPRETVVAEKFEALVSLEMFNSRMKDFSDLYHLSREFEFDGPPLRDAISATFERRGTAPPTGIPLALTHGFYESTEKQIQWTAWVRKAELHTANPGLEQVCLLLKEFLLPPVQAILTAVPFNMSWPPGGPWKSKSSRDSKE